VNSGYVLREFPELFGTAYDRKYAPHLNRKTGLARKATRRSVPQPFCRRPFELSGAAVFLRGSPRHNNAQLPPYGVRRSCQMLQRSENRLHKWNQRSRRDWAGNGTEDDGAHSRSTFLNPDLRKSVAPN
jgi:hypothetical protein